MYSKYLQNETWNIKIDLLVLEKKLKKVFFSLALCSLRFKRKALKFS